MSERNTGLSTGYKLFVRDLRRCEVGFCFVSGLSLPDNLKDTGIDWLKRVINSLSGFDLQPNL